MNEHIQELYSQSFVPTPPVKGTARLTKDILWEQPDHFDPGKFAELILDECMEICENLGAEYLKLRLNEMDFSEKNIYAEGETAALAIKRTIKLQFGVK